MDLGAPSVHRLTSEFKGGHEDLTVFPMSLPVGYQKARDQQPDWVNPLFASSGVTADDSYLRCRPRRETYDRTFSQCAISTRTSYNAAILRRAVNRYISILESRGVVHSTVWSWGDVYNHLNGTSSAGYPFRGRTQRKREAFHKGFHLIREYWDNAHTCATPVFTGSQKEEMRPRLKVESDSYRLFCSGSIIDYAFAMRLYGALLEQLTALNLDVGFWPGATHFYEGWDSLYQRLHRGGGENPRFYAVDGTKFDMTQSYEVLVDCVLPVLRHFAPPGEKDRAESCLHDIVVCILRHPCGDAYYLDKNNKSGSAFTIHVNMILQGVILEYTRILHGYDEPWYYALCGDDNIMGKRDDGFDPFQCYPDFGIVLKYQHDSEKLEDLEFLSKGFKTVGVQVVPFVSVQKHLCSLKREPSVDPAAYVVKINSLILESCWSEYVEDLVKLRAHVMPFVHESESTEFKTMAVASWRSLEEARDLHRAVPEGLEV